MKTKDTLAVDYGELLRKMKDRPVGKVAKVLWENSFLGQLVGLGKALSQMGGLTEDDMENIRRIIEAGRKEGVKEMDIEMEREQWLGLKAKGNVDGVDVEAGFGEGGKTGYRIWVKYK